METFWYAALTIMLAVYVILDGFDFGVGIIYPFVARTEQERRMALASIGPVFSGNEVWLVASGGVLFFAFPKAYAAGFSGFYLALIIVLWLLILRGLALELRSHLDHPLWRQLGDVVFSAASLLLAIVFGAALGNLIRGVPLNSDGYFFVAFWTDFSAGPAPGILDWYTILTGVASVAILALHGANYLAMKTEGELYRRAVATAKLAGWLALGSAILVRLGITFVQPGFLLNYMAHPVGYLFSIGGAMALVATLVFGRRQRDISAFRGLQPVHRRHAREHRVGLLSQYLDRDNGTGVQSHNLQCYRRRVRPESRDRVVSHRVGTRHRLPDLCAPLFLGKGPDPLSSRLKLMTCDG